MEAKDKREKKKKKGEKCFREKRIEKDIRGRAALWRGKRKKRQKRKRTDVDG